MGDSDLGIITSGITKSLGESMTLHPESIRWENWARVRRLQDADRTQLTKPASVLPDLASDGILNESMCQSNYKWIAWKLDWEKSCGFFW